MKVTLVMVSSVNGKITRGDDPDVTNWTSTEDKILFQSLIKKSSLIVMGRQTYEAGKSRIKLQPGKLRIVLTQNPKRYTSIPDQLEFTNEPPKDLLLRLEKQGHKELLLVGGGEINALFLRQHLINEIHLTIEPLLFGKGKSLLAEDIFAVPLKLMQTKKLNKQGTLHLIYSVDE